MEKPTAEKETGKNGTPLQSGPEGVDKAPGEEANRNEPVTNKDLKGKKVDADPSKEADKPVEDS